MTTALLRREVRRFLADPTPEVLCVRGRWGVGKTYAWLKFLGEAQTAGDLKVSLYSYVSLFGLNSLNDLRYAIFESTVATSQYLSGPDIGTLQSLLAKGMDWGRKARPFLDTIGGMLGRKDAGEAIARASFLLVRNQLICLDDLERAGNGLKQRDVLGLASFLKEQRKCKIVLLLNDEQMDDAQRKEFDRQLEKVVDISLRFDPTPAEAAAIALDDAGPTGRILTPLVEKLGIVNIRVIKKIERMSKLLRGILLPCGDAVVGQALATVTLGVWSTLEPGVGPSPAFLRDYQEIAFGMRATNGKLDADEEKWYRLLQDYGYNTTDELDLLILDGVGRGAFDEAAVLERGRQLQQSLAECTREDPFSKAWDRFHGDFVADDDEILDGVVDGALQDLARVSPLNLNGTVRLLREMKRDAQADDLIMRYVDAHAADRTTLDLSGNHFMSTSETDPILAKAFADKVATFVDDRDPRAVLDHMVERQGWNPQDIDLLAKIDAAGYVAIFESLRSSRLRQSIELLRSIGSHPGGETIGPAVDDALRRIAARSPLRALRMRRYGVELVPPNAEAPMPSQADSDHASPSPTALNAPTASDIAASP